MMFRTNFFDYRIYHFLYSETNYDDRNKEIVYFHYPARIRFMVKKKKIQTDEKDLFGVEKYYNKYAQWTVDLSQGKGIAIIIVGLILSSGIVATTLLLPLPEWSIPLLTWPIGLFIFLVLLAIAIRRANNDEDIVTVKERFSFRQRIKIGIIVTIVFVAILLSVSSYIPNSIGGIAAIVYVLSFINTIRRTPEEIELFNLGLIDERDIAEDEYDEEKAQFFEEDEEYIDNEPEQPESNDDVNDDVNDDERRGIS